MTPETRIKLNRAIGLLEGTKWCVSDWNKKCIGDIRWEGVVSNLDETIKLVEEALKE